MSSVTGIRPLIRRLERMRERASRPGPALADAGEHIVASIQLNFDVGGRPVWRPLSPNTRPRGGSILNRSGDLRGSFAPHVMGKSVSVDSDSVYGPRQHYGYGPAGKTGPGQVYTPARPFAKLQDEDVPIIGQAIGGYIWG